MEGGRDLQIRGSAEGWWFGGGQNVVNKGRDRRGFGLFWSKFGVVCRASLDSNALRCVDGRQLGGTSGGGGLGRDVGRGKAKFGRREGGIWGGGGQGQDGGAKDGERQGSEEVEAGLEWKEGVICRFGDPRRVGGLEGGRT